MRRFGVLFFILLALLLVAAQVKLVILHTTDIHGNIYPINYATNKHYDVGLGKVWAFYKQISENETKNILLIDTGDLIQGTPFAYYYAKVAREEENPIVKVMNYMGFVASIIGNHEFNYGIDYLKKVVDEAKFPFLSANTVYADTKKPVFKPYTIVEVNGIKVGIVGVVTKYIPNWEDPKNIPNIEYLDPVEAAKKYVNELKDKVDVIVVGYHGGFERDPKTGEPTEELTGENQAYEILKTVKGIDALLLGHQHRAMYGVVDGVAYTMPKKWGQMVGKITLVLDDSSGKWKVISKKAELLDSKTIKASEEVLNLVKKEEETVQKWLDKPIGTAIGDFYVYDPLKTRLEDNPLIEFVNKVQMYYSKAKISSTALFNNSIKGWKAGPIKIRDIYGVYIYPNTLKVLRVKGADIKAALEKSADYFVYKDGVVDVNKTWVDPKPRHYNYDMWEGIRYVIDVTKPVGNRIVWLEFEGKPVEMDKEYEIVLNNYRAGGGGGYSMFRGKPIVREVMMEVAELMVDYVMKHKVIRATTDNNWFVGVEVKYEVKPGDTLWSIGAKYCLNPYVIAKWNGIDNPDIIYAGQILTIYKPVLCNK